MAKVRTTEAYRTNPGFETHSALSKAVEAPRQRLIRRLNMTPGATRRLVSMRGHVLDVIDERPERLGVNSDVIAIDDQVEVLGFVSMRDAHRLLPVYMTLPTGREVVMTLGPAKEFGLADEDAQDNTTLDEAVIGLATGQANGLFGGALGRTHLDRGEQKLHGRSLR